MRRLIFIAVAVMLGLSAHAGKITITQTSCNYQSGEMAIVEGAARVGWQMGTATITAPEEPVAYQILVVERITGRIVYDSQRTVSQESQHIPLPALPANDYGYEWKVRVWNSTGEVSDWSRWQTIRIMPTLDSRPQWIGAITKKDARIPEGRWSNAEFKKAEFKEAWANVDSLSAQSIILCRQFQTSRKVVDAMAYISGLGHYELSINGKKVGDSEFAPLWSEYTKTVYYNVYDVTRELRQGQNTIDVLLGNGFFNVQRMGRYSKLQTSFGAPQLWMKLVVCYDDGSRDEIVSDGSWHWKPSPITYNCIYGGESYDARLEGRAEGEMQQAVVVEGPQGILRAQTAPPVKIMEYYSATLLPPPDKDSLAAAAAKTKRTIDPSVFVCDMQQNLAGFPQITVSGKRGQKVTLLVSENLTPQGVCDQSQTGRQHYYEYTLKGEGRETWHPRFSYYGFRYIQVEGAVMEGQPNPSNLPVLHELKSCFVYSSAPELSSFQCNNELFTQTHRLIERAERSNMQAVLSDCPHREKLGWLEQDHLCGPSLLYNYDMTTYIPKVIRDIVDTQKPNGMVPTTAPQYVSFGNLFDDSPEWGSTLVILPFMYYDMYGDSTLITDNYEPMRRYVDYLGTRAEDGIVSHGLGDWYDYGPWRAGFSRNTPVPLVATAHYIYDLQLVAEAARMVGKHEDAKKYQGIYHKTVDAFNRHFYKPDSCYYGTGSQTSNALPLFLGIAGDNKEAVLQHLINDIHAHGDRLTTGDVGNRYLFRVLADNGQSELLFRMLNHYETPGYGFQIRQGATTLTEQWDPRQGSSWNHFMMGQIDEWLFRSLAGIGQKPGTHGMKHLVIKPQLVGDITEIDVTVPTLYGPVHLQAVKGLPPVVTYPVGCTADIYLPESSTSLDADNPIEFMGDCIRYAGETIKLGPKTLYVDGRLSDAEAAKHPYAFNTFQQAAEHFTDGTEQEPMTVYIAPWVYWIDDPDDPAIRRGINGQQPFGMVIHCEHLHLIGLNPDARNIVLASQRGQTQGAVGNFQMFDFHGDGLTIKNMTLGNYCNVDLEFPLYPSLNRKKRMPAITQAHVAGCHGDRAFAQNVRFISRLNMTPLSGARRLLFDHCHMESTDDALASQGVYLHCTLDFYGQKPFWSSGTYGAAFLDCDFTIHHDKPRTYFCKSIAPVNVVDSRIHCGHPVYVGNTHTPTDWLRSYQYNVLLDGQPYIIGADKPYNTVCMEQKSILGAYRLLADGDSIVYNTYNLLRGDDGWDPMGIRTQVETLGKRDGRDYANIATTLLVTPQENSLQTGSAPVTLKAGLFRHGGYPLNGEKIHWRVEPGKERYVALSATEGSECTVTPLLDDDNPVHVDIIAYTDDGLEGCAELSIRPAFVEPPAFITKPTIILREGMAQVDYQLDLQGRKDESIITWYRNGIPVMTSRLGQPERTYPLRPEDAGCRLSVKVEPKHLRCEAGEGIIATTKGTIKKSLVTATDTYETDFRNFPTTVQRKVIPGYWTVDSYKPADTNDFDWQAQPDQEIWYYGEGINGCVGTGLYALGPGGRLRYTPLSGSYGDMAVTVDIDPSKTAGQGFSSARQQYLDIYLKYDTRTLTGYGLRIIRTTKYHNAVDFLLIRSDKGTITPISDPVSTICYITGCTITLKVEGNRLTAHAETSSPLHKVSDPELKPVVDLSADITPNTWGGFGLMYTGNAGEGANMLHRLKIVTSALPR